MRLLALHCVLVAVVGLFAGCGRKKTLSYEEALPRFRIGMTTQEVLKEFGEPSFINDLGGEIVWDYTPSERLKPPVSKVHGFDIYFRDGRAREIVKNTLTSSRWERKKPNKQPEPMAVLRTAIGSSLNVRRRNA